MSKPKLTPKEKAIQYLIEKEEGEERGTHYNTGILKAIDIALKEQARKHKERVELLKERMNKIKSGDDFLNHKKDLGDIYFSKEQIIEWINDCLWTIASNIYYGCRNRKFN